MADYDKKKKFYIIVSAIILLVCIGFFTYYYFYFGKGAEESAIKYIEPVSLSGELKEYQNKEVGVAIDVPKEYTVDDTQYSKDFPYIGFIAPGYEAKIDVTHWPKQFFFANGGYRTLEEYFSFKKDFWKASGLWIEGDPITIEGIKAYYMVTKFGSVQKESTVLFEKGDDIYQVKLFEFREDPGNSEILKKVIRSVKLTD